MLRINEVAWEQLRSDPQRELTLKMICEVFPDAADLMLTTFAGLPRNVEIIQCPRFEDRQAGNK